MENEIITNDKDLAFTSASADMFRLMSMFLIAPTMDIAQGVFDGSIGEDVDAIFADLNILPATPYAVGLADLQTRNTSVKEVLVEIRRDYTKLFTHPKKPLISIYEMQFMDHLNKAQAPSTLFLNEAALHAEQCYKKAGLILATGGSREPGDHMAIELEFMSYLYTQLASAIYNNEAEKENQYREYIAEFRLHLETWALAFFSACADCGYGTIYPWLGQAGCEFFKYFLDYQNEADNS